MVQSAQTQVLQARNWVQASLILHGSNHDWKVHASLGDCDKLYDESKYWLARLLSGESYTRDDALAWLSGVLANHRSCLDGLGEKGYVEAHVMAKNLTKILSEALALYGKGVTKRRGK